ncbi:hypothetical protein I204_06370 [Kwoniella mangroviensis CBS 8886]|nr:hypothetical protein I204_06370 [Kwoniella mangroviensis CBS 8886]
MDADEFSSNTHTGPSTSIQLSRIDTNVEAFQHRDHPHLGIPASAHSQLSETSSGQPSPMRATVEGPLDPHMYQPRATKSTWAEHKLTATQVEPTHSSVSSSLSASAIDDRNRQLSSEGTNANESKDGSKRQPTTADEMTRTSTQYSDLIPVNPSPFAPYGVTEPPCVSWIRSESTETLDDRPSEEIDPRDTNHHALRILRPSYYPEESRRNKKRGLNNHESSEYRDQEQTIDGSRADQGSGSLCGSFKECLRSFTG